MKLCATCYPSRMPVRMTKAILVSAHWSTRIQFEATNRFLATTCQVSGSSSVASSLLTYKPRLVKTIFKLGSNLSHQWINIRTYSKSTNQTVTIAVAVVVDTCHYVLKGEAGCPAMNICACTTNARDSTSPGQVDKRTSMEEMLGWTLNIVPAWPETSWALQRIVLQRHWRQRIGWKIKMECLKLLILTAACLWDIERDKETKNQKKPHTCLWDKETSHSSHGTRSEELCAKYADDSCIALQNNNYAMKWGEKEKANWGQRECDKCNQCNHHNCLLVDALCCFSGSRGFLESFKQIDRSYEDKEHSAFTSTLVNDLEWKNLSAFHEFGAFLGPRLWALLYLTNRKVAQTFSRSSCVVRWLRVKMLDAFKLWECTPVCDL